MYGTRQGSNSRSLDLQSEANAALMCNKYQKLMNLLLLYQLLLTIENSAKHMNQAI